MTNKDVVFAKCCSNYDSNRAQDLWMRFGQDGNNVMVLFIFVCQFWNTKDYYALVYAVRCILQLPLKDGNFSDIDRDFIQSCVRSFFGEDSAIYKLSEEIDAQLCKRNSENAAEVNCNYVNDLCIFILEKLCAEKDFDHTSVIFEDIALFNKVSGQGIKSDKIIDRKSSSDLRIIEARRVELENITNGESTLGKGGNGARIGLTYAKDAFIYMWGALWLLVVLFPVLSTYLYIGHLRHDWFFQNDAAIEFFYYFVPSLCLIIVMIMLKFQSKRAGTYSAIPFVKGDFDAAQRPIFGISVPYKKDNYYKLYQVVPFVMGLFVFLLIRSFQAIQAESEFADAAAGVKVFFNIEAWLIWGGITGIIIGVAAGIWQHFKLQSTRINSSRDIYWWDMRIDKFAYIVRLYMIVWSFFVFSICLFLVIFMSVYTAQYLGSEVVEINPFHPDRLMSLGDVMTNIYYQSFIAALFFPIIFLSLYFHAKHVQYSSFNKAISIVFPVFWIIHFLWMSDLVYARIRIEISKIMDDGIRSAGTEFLKGTEIVKDADSLTFLSELSGALSQVQNSIFNVATLSSPLVILLAQVGFAIFQVSRGRSRPITPEVFEV